VTCAAVLMTMTVVVAMVFVGNGGWRLMSLTMIMIDDEGDVVAIFCNRWGLCLTTFAFTILFVISVTFNSRQPCSHLRCCCCRVCFRWAPTVASPCYWELCCCGSCHSSATVILVGSTPRDLSSSDEY